MISVDPVCYHQDLERGEKRRGEREQNSRGGTQGMQGLLCAVQLGFTRKVIAETVPVTAWGGWLRPEGWGGGEHLKRSKSSAQVLLSGAACSEEAKIPQRERDDDPGGLMTRLRFCNLISHLECSYPLNYQRIKLNVDMGESSIYVHMTLSEVFFSGKHFKHLINCFQPVGPCRFLSH